MKAHEVAQIIGQRIGREFTFDGFWYEHNEKRKHRKLILSLDTYDTEDENDGEPFVGVGIEMTKSQFRGSHSPVDSIDEAVEWFERKIKEYDNWKEDD